MGRFRILLDDNEDMEDVDGALCDAADSQRKVSSTRTIDEPSHDDDDDDDDDDNDDDDDEEEENEDDEEDDEPPHPLGFSYDSWGRTRFTLARPPAQKSALHYQTFFDDDDDEQQESDMLSMAVQPMLPASIQSRRIHPRVASNQSLWECRVEQRCQEQKQQPTLSLRNGPDQQEQRQEQLDPMMQLLCQTTSRLRLQDGSASTVQNAPSKVFKHELVLDKIGEELQQVTKWGNERRKKLQQSMEQEKKQIEHRHHHARKALRQLMKQDHDQAKRVLQQEKAAAARAEQEKEAAAKEEEAKRRQLENEREEALERQQKQRAEQERRKQEEDERQRQQQPLEPTVAAAASSSASQPERETSSLSTSSPPYVEKAQSLVRKLVDIRASIEPFEKNRAISRRRLEMKKACRGKVNTLAADVYKVQSVAGEISQAIAREKQQDEQIKRELENRTPNVTPDMARGRRYFVDLLASTAMVRCQAEGFNGTRGDGFPLAAFLAMVSAEHKELVPVMMAHVYTVCPIAIPTLPKLSKNASEDEVMESLGMIKDKRTGDYENFERFLSRTEGIVSLVADIMSSHPGNHLLFGGNRNAVEWLDRFLKLLPPAPEVLPIITAPVLDGFLTGAGHMMAHKFRDRFKKQLDTITNDLIKRLDEGPIGASRALRLKKTVEVGIDGFRDTLPSRALEPLYYTGGSPPPLAPPPQPAASASAAFPSGPFGDNNPVVTNPFGGTENTTVTNPFGMSSTTNTTPFGNTNPFGGGSTQTGRGNDEMDASNNGGQHQEGESDMAVAETEYGAPFGGGGNNNNNGFGTNQASGFSSNTAFGQPSPFTSPAPAPTPFTAVGVAPAPFGAPAPAPFVSKPPFLAPSPAQTPFGKTQAPTPFGKPSTIAAPFGSTNNTNPTPFGAASINTQTTPFGAPAAAAPSAPFSSGSSGAPTPFGNATPFGGTPFGTNNNNNNTKPFGSSAAPSPSPFGAANQNPTPFGAGNNNNNQTTTPFGAGNNNNNQSTTPFGGAGGKKQLCRYFAQGNCRYGASCRYSHEMPNNNNSGGGFGNNNNNNNAFGFGNNNNASATPFGGPRR